MGGVFKGLVKREKEKKRKGEGKRGEGRRGEGRGGEESRGLSEAPAMMRIPSSVARLQQGGPEL